MSQLGYMEKLLDGVEVEWKELWQVTIWDKKFNAVERDKQPRVVKYHYFLAKNLKSLAIENGNVKLLTTNLSNLWTSEELAGEKVSEGEVIAIPWGGNPVVQYYKGKFLTTDNRIATSADTDLLNNKFLYYYLLSQIDLISSFYRGSGIKHPNMNDVLHISIPIPPIHIQAEIVRILDTFTELTAELTAELKARQQQYAYYRDKLLTFEEGGVEWKTLGEIGHIVTGRTPKSSNKSAWGNDVDFVTPSDIKNGMRNITFPSRRLSAEGAASMSKVLIPSGSLLVTCIGADMGKTVINANDCIPNQQINAITLTDDSVQVSYLFHVLTAMREALRRQGELGGGTMPLINKSDFSKIVVPIPSHEEQNRIATILDKFDALTKSITEGLPCEIELRQQQYEYYRDLLLNFPKPEVVAHD